MTVMHRTKTTAAHHHREAGFVLALGLLLLATLALIGTAALSSASFQSDMANNIRENQEAYYVSTVGLAYGVERMLQEFPGNVRTRASGNPLLIAAFDRKTGQMVPVPAGCAAGDHGCICASLGRQDCYDFYVEVVLKKCGHAQGSSLDKFVTLFYRMSTTATGFHGNSSTVRMDVAGTYPGYCANP